MNHPTRSAFLGAAAALAAATRASAQPSQLTTLHGGGVPDDSATPAIWAQQSGLFRKHDLDVPLQQARSGSAVVAAVVGGTFQVGKSSLVSLLAAHTRGVPIVIVAPAGVWTSSNPIIAGIVRKDSPLRTGADLNGKTIAVSSLGDLYALAFRAWIDKNGGDSTTTKFVELPMSAVPEAVAAGRIDAGTLEEPELHVALADGKVRVLAATMDAIAPTFVFTAWFMTTDFVAQNRDVVARFVAAMREAAIYANAHPAQTVTAAASFNGMTEATVATMKRVTAGIVLDEKLIQPVIEIAARYKLIAGTFDAKAIIR